MQQYKVLVTDGVSPRGVEVLKTIPAFNVIESKSLKEDELKAAIVDVDALIVRSQTKVSEAVLQVANKLKVVGRAGVGVDNVDVDASTEKGIVVMNTPGGSTISTAEHAFSLLLSMARHIPQAHASMKEGKWDRKNFQGVEVNNKVLGIIGMGRIGSEVARRAFAFGMRVLAYDPYLSLSRAKSMQVELFEKLDEMLPLCDFITMHMPLTDETRNILNKKNLALCKPSVRIVNCARGGLISEADLEEMLKAGKVAAAALDVYETEPAPADLGLRQLPQVVMTPHLGASTDEAQENVGIEITEAIRDMLLTGTIRNAVNMPNVDAKTLSLLRPYLNLGVKLGRMIAQMSPSRCDQLVVTYCGKISEYDTTSVTRAILKGFLSQAGGMNVNEVNAMKYAQGHGIKVSEIRQSELENYSELISVKTISGSVTHEISGTFFGAHPRIVSVNGNRVEAAPEGVLFIMENKDRPGIVGWIGTLLGRHQVNIANMSLSRAEKGSNAVSVLNLDSQPSTEVLKEITADADIFSVYTIQL